MRTIAKVIFYTQIVVLAACASSSGRTGQSFDTTMNRDGSTNGVVPYVWEEPMVDVIDVPPGLDPEGHYYRPAHQEVVEIRQGHWKYNKPQ